MATVRSVQADELPAYDLDGLRVEVACGVLVVALAVVPLLFGLPHDGVDADALLPVLVWPVLGVAGLVALDRAPGSRHARACVAAAPVPCVVLGAAALLREGAGSGVERFAASAAELGPVTSLALLLPAVAGPRSRDHGGVERSARRWRWWSSAVASTTLVVGAATWWWVSPAAYGVVTALGVVALAAVVVASALGRPPRPVSEPVVDAVLVLLALASGALVGLLVLAFARAERIFAPPVLGTLACVATLALAAPTALWARREWLRRRYGSDAISPGQVATISDAIGAREHPRALLDRAAAVVADLGGVAEARLLLDEAEAPGEPGWAAVPLEVSAQPVGTLLVRAHDPEGLEDRQLATLTRLVPTLALVAHAVALAVDAGHARSDAVCQREQERARILADLHDDLGPVLVGMGLRVEALRLSHPSEELVLLADDLAGARGDLRRIVEDLAPPAVAQHDLATAVARLTGGFGVGGGLEVRVREPVPEDVAPDVASVTYRIVAEAVTNAVRHARPARVDVVVVRQGDALEVEVRDDGDGAVLVPGTGLLSLRARAEQAGGELQVVSQPGGGTTVRARIPEARG